MNLTADPPPESPRAPWLLPGDYGDALIHIGWLVIQGKRFLVFGLVELFPSELPPPDETPECTWDYRYRGITHRVYLTRVRLSADAALSWYANCRSGKVILPGNREPNALPKLLEVAEFWADPQWPNAVVANEIAFISRSWGTVRIHHLLQSATLPAIDSLFQCDDALRWFSDRLFFDLAEFREWVGSMHLVAPNPVFRNLDRHRRIADDGEETTIVRIVARAGQTLDGLWLHVTEHGPTGIIAASSIKIAGPLTLVRHLGTVESVSHRVICPQRGLLDWSSAEPYVASIVLNMKMVESERKVTVPSLPRRPGETYTVPVLGSTIPAESVRLHSHVNVTAYVMTGCPPGGA
ncbi:MAG: hypothetical protein M1118_12615 [Chloroflexi bacterium]|nr:hypothetical protein [Chloroflexota bacterium]